MGSQQPGWNNIRVPSSILDMYGCITNLPLWMDELLLKLGNHPANFGKLLSVITTGTDEIPAVTADDINAALPNIAGIEYSAEQQSEMATKLGMLRVVEVTRLNNLQPLLFYAILATVSEHSRLRIEADDRYRSAQATFDVAMLMCCIRATHSGAIDVSAKAQLKRRFESIKQQRNESASDYNIRFEQLRKLCVYHNVSISEERTLAYQWIAGLDRLRHGPMVTHMTNSRTLPNTTSEALEQASNWKITIGQNRSDNADNIILPRQQHRKVRNNNTTAVTAAVSEQLRKSKKKKSERTTATAATTKRSKSPTTPTRGTLVTPVRGAPLVTPVRGAPLVAPVRGAPLVTPVRGAPLVTPVRGAPSARKNASTKPTKSGVASATTRVSTIPTKPAATGPAGSGVNDPPKCLDVATSPEKRVRFGSNERTPASGKAATVPNGDSTGSDIAISVQHGAKNDRQTTSIYSWAKTIIAAVMGAMTMLICMQQRHDLNGHTTLATNYKPGRHNEPPTIAKSSENMSISNPEGKVAWRLGVQSATYTFTTHSM